MRSVRSRGRAGLCSFKDLQPLLQFVEGWLTAAEAEVLYSLAQECPRDTVIVEIGSFKGKSTICLAKGAEAGSKAHIFAVDPHLEGTQGAFLKNLEAAQVSARVTPVCKPSRDANQGWTQPIGLLFIDGNHEYTSVEEDFLLWSPYVVDGGVIACHDTTSSVANQLMGYPGPRRVADRYLFAAREMDSIDFVDTMTFATKGRALGWRRDVHRWSVWFKKLFPDTLLYLHHYVISRLPAGVLDALRRVLYKKHRDGSPQSRKTVGRATHSEAHGSPTDLGGPTTGIGGRRNSSAVLYFAEGLDVLNSLL